jgi:hypothetical protein
MALLSAASVIGCGGTAEDQIKLVRVTGKITLNGKPLAGADVSFVPQPGNKDSTPGIDQSGPDGNYMVSFKGRTGVAPGKYRVFVTPADPEAESQIPEKFKNDPMMFKIMKGSQGATKTTQQKAIAKGEFDAEVPDKDVVLDFDVKATSSAGGAAKS